MGCCGEEKGSGSAQSQHEGNGSDGGKAGWVQAAAVVLIIALVLGLLIRL